MNILIDILKDSYDLIKPAITADNIALFSVLVTILIFIINRQSELRYKKQEDCKNQYIKLIELLQITYTEPEKMKPNKQGKISPDIQKHFFDTGASLMLYASKKLYKQYIFFRDFTTSKHLKLSKYYSDDLIVYIIADILKQIRKEVGLTNWQSISSNEALAFFVNNLGTNPAEKKPSYNKIYRIKMLKLELFFINCYKLIPLHKIYYLIIKPIFGFLHCCFIFMIFLPIKKIFGPRNKKESEN